ncbi:AI-2E family transporter [Sulfurimonas sp. SAG-AH-194-L11]|nr:AI-2E family transporter [Sulfurimonas sp. SAG-AH-194-L11]MDF1877305.1 AI-2E family transporter [Sulfurimonas sp. SAG-AH-194-L11]
MKPQFFIAALFAVSLYGMYYLYSPFLLVILIAGLLAISTSNIQNFFEHYLKNKLLASLVSSLLLAVLFFAPLGYFLTTLTIELNNLSAETIHQVEASIRAFVNNPPSYLLFLKPYLQDTLKELDINSLTSNALGIAGYIGAFSAGFLKNAFLVIIFYFFALYNGSVMINFLKRIVQMSVEESTLLARELSDVMSVVFYSIIATAMFQGILFGAAISYMGYNGLLFGIMYGFASLIPVIGGILMWLPFMIYEFSIGNNTNAIFIAIYSIIMISIIADTFIKPIIIREINQRLLNEGDTKMNELVIFFAIIAGLTTFGFWGMILGPAITAFFFTILKLFEARSQECLDKNLNI